MYKLKQHPSYYADMPHTMSDRTPYTYLIGWKDLNIWYYGRRTGKDCHPTELFSGCRGAYKTSSTYVSRFIEEHGFPNVIEIRSIFADTQSCADYETRVLIRLDCASDTRFLNQSNSGGMFNNAGKTTVVDVFGNVFLVSVTDARFISGEYINIKKGKSGKPTSEETKRKLSIAGLGRVGPTPSATTRSKISAALLGRTHSDSTLYNIKMSHLKYYYTLISPEGIEYKIESLPDIRRDFNLSHDTLNKYANSEVPFISTKSTSEMRKNTIGWKLIKSLIE